MFDSSPIDSWDGAGVIYSFAGSGMTDFWFWIAVICCIVPLYFALQTENHHEKQHTFREGDSDSTHGVER